MVIAQEEPQVARLQLFNPPPSRIASSWCLAAVKMT
jgi:hypothetical protein